MSESVREPDEEDHTSRPGFHAGRRLLRHISLQLLGVRQMERSDHRRLSADFQRSSGLHAFARQKRVLDGADGESLCQVRS